MKIVYKNRPVELSVTGNYDDDITIEEAYYTDGLSEESALTDSEMDEIQEKYADDLYQEWFENQVCAADYYYDD